MAFAACASTLSSLLSLVPVLVLCLLAQRIIVDALAPGLGENQKAKKQGP